MRSTVSMMLAPGWRKIITSTDGFPLAYPALRRSSTESTTSPTSPTRTDGAVVIGDEQRLIVDGVEKLVVGADLVHLAPVGEMSFGSVGVGRWPARRGPVRGRCRICSARWDSTPRVRREVRSRPTPTCPTPCTCASFCAMMVDAESYICALAQRVGRERDHEDRGIGRIHLAVGGIRSADWSAGTRAPPQWPPARRARRRRYCGSGRIAG